MKRNYHVKTPNFSYILQINKTSRTIEFYVGTQTTTHLEGHFYLPDDTYKLPTDLETLYLNNIDALEKSALDYENENSFGLELLYSLIQILKANYPKIKKITLHDNSYITCQRPSCDIMDAVVYGIVLYGRSWYEKVANAQIYLENRRGLYQENIKNYISPEFKQSVPFESLVRDARINMDAFETIILNFEFYRSMYETSATFPDFFKKIIANIEKSKRYKFLRNWLEWFIDPHVYISRHWIIDIENNPVLGNVLNVSQVRPMSPRPRTAKHRKNRKQGSRCKRKK
jgi:hypothetical protein